LRAINRSAESAHNSIPSTFHKDSSWNRCIGGACPGVLGDVQHSDPFRGDAFEHACHSIRVGSASLPTRPTR